MSPGVDGLNLMQLIENAGGEDSLARVGSSAGLSDSELSAILRSASPLLIRKLQERMQDAQGRNWIRRQRDSGGPQQFIDRPMLMDSSAVGIEGNRVLDSLVGGQSVAEQIGLRLADQTGVNLKKVQKMLPAVAVLFVGAVCKGIS